MGNCAKITEYPMQTGKHGQSLPISAKRVFEVSFSSYSADNAVTACIGDDDTIQIPTAGDQLSATYPTLKAQAPDAKRLGSAEIYRVTVNYLTDSSSIGGRKAVSPLSRAVIWNGSGSQITIETDFNTGGFVLQTSGLQTKKVSLPWAHHAVQAINNEATMVNYRSYWWTTNNASVTLSGTAEAADTVLMQPISQQYTEENYEGDLIAYWVVTYNFLVLVPRKGDKLTTWNQLLLNEGTKFLDTDGEQVSVARGGAISVGETRLDDLGLILDPADDDPFYLEGGAHATGAGGGSIGWSQTPTNGVRVFESKDWSTLPPLV